MIMDDGLHREPGKGWIPFRQQQRMPQAAHATISIDKGMDQFQFIVEHTDADQHVYLTGLIIVFIIPHITRFINQSGIAFERCFPFQYAELL